MWKGGPVVQDKDRDGDAAEERPGISEPADAAHDGGDERDPGEAPAEAPPRAPEPVPPEPARRRGGFLAPFLGGILAAVIGFAFALWLGYMTPDQLPFGMGRYIPFGIGETRVSNAERISAVDERLTAISGDVSGLQDRVADMPDPVTAPELEAALADVTQPLTERIDDLASRVEQFAGRVEGFGGRLDALDQRVTSVEARPVGEAADVSAATAAFRNQLEAMRGELTAQRERNKEVVGEIQAATDKAMARIDEAAARVRDLERQAAMTRLAAAVEAGAPFASALSSLGADTISEVLGANAGTGVPSLESLKAGFDDSARQALSAALGATVEGGPADRLTAFLQSQLQARPLTPREGSGPGAVLARARADVAAGRLSEALAEIETLPAPARDALAGWTQRARLRLDALAAVDALAKRLGQG